jgi:hypothetical protein
MGGWFDLCVCGVIERGVDGRWGSCEAGKGVRAEGRLLGLGCSLCASPGTRRWRVCADWAFGCARGAPRWRGTGTFSRWPFSVGGWGAGLNAGLMGRENEPVPGDHGRWASIGSRMFALCVPRDAVLGAFARIGISDVRRVRPGGGGQAHFPAGFSSAAGGLAFGELIHAGGKMSQSPGIIADGRLLGLGCSRCASPGWR